LNCNYNIFTLESLADM